MNKELQIKTLETRIAILEGRHKDNEAVVSKLRRKLRLLKA